MSTPITTMTIGGASVNLTLPSTVANGQQCVLGRMVAFVKDGIPTLTFYRRGRHLVPNLGESAYPINSTDAWLGKKVVLSIEGTVRFQGDVVSSNPHYENRVGWVVAYQALGLRYRGNMIPFTDDNTGLDTTMFNQQPEDPSYNAARAGRTVGQILQDVLSSSTNAINLYNMGLGAYRSMTPVLMAIDTLSDLASMLVIPPSPVHIGGQKLIAALDAFLSAWAPNYTLWIDPATGSLRFLDMRAFGGSGYATSGACTLTMGTDPIYPCSLSRDTTDCYQRIWVRGQPWIEPILLSTLAGTLVEAWDSSLTAGWTPSDFIQPTLAKSEGGIDSGTCTCPSTTTVVVNPSDDTFTWSANFWDQTSSGAHGIITLSRTVSGNTGMTQFCTRRIVANTSLAAAGTSTLTLDMPLPVTNFTSYWINGEFTSGKSLVWRKYKPANADVGAALQKSFSYPVAYVGAGGTSASLTSIPVGSVLWSTVSAGGGPYNQFPLPFTQTVDVAHGANSYFLFVKPTWEIANMNAPYDVQVLAAVATGANYVTYPQNASSSLLGTPRNSPSYVVGTPVYGGTSYTVEGLTNTLVVTIDQWRDPGQIFQMASYAQDLFDTVKDAVVEGDITIAIAGKSVLDNYLKFLSMGWSIEVKGTAVGAGNAYTTGWENTSKLTSFGRGLQIVMAELEWNHSAACPWTMRLRCSNRRAYNTASGFLKPERTGMSWEGFDGLPFGDLKAQQVVGLLEASGRGSTMNAIESPRDESVPWFSQSKGNGFFDLNG